MLPVTQYPNLFFRFRDPTLIVADQNNFFTSVCSGQAVKQHHVFAQILLVTVQRFKIDAENLVAASSELFRR